MPAIHETGYAWRWFFAMEVCTERTTSWRIGARKMAGIGMVAPASPSLEAAWTVTTGRAAAVAMVL